MHKIGSGQDLMRASTAVQMDDYKRQCETPVPARELGNRTADLDGLETPAERLPGALGSGIGARDGPCRRVPR